MTVLRLRPLPSTACPFSLKLTLIVCVHAADQSGIIGEGIIDSEIQYPDPEYFIWVENSC